MNFGMGRGISAWRKGEGGVFINLQRRMSWIKSKSGKPSTIKTKTKTVRRVRKVEDREKRGSTDRKGEIENVFGTKDVRMKGIKRQRFRQFRTAW